MKNNRSLILTGSSGSFGSDLLGALCEDFTMVYGLDIHGPPAGTPSNFKFIECDLTDFSKITKVLEGIFSDNQVDSLVNVAGRISNSMLINPLKKGTERFHGLELWQSTLELNLGTTFKTTMAFADLMFKARRPGVVVNVSSVSAEGNIGQSAYSAAKAGVEALTKVWAKELAPFRIRCSCVSPGFFDTPSTHHALSPENVKYIQSKVPSKKLGNTESLRQAVLFCLKNDYFNGQILKVDGGINL